MRKVTAKAVEAFMKGQPGIFSNTSVELSGCKVILKLHGNAIAKYDRGNFATLKICNGGWSSATTKERLNGIPGVHVNQVNYVWYLNSKKWNGELVMPLPYGFLYL